MQQLAGRPDQQSDRQDPDDEPEQDTHPASHGESGGIVSLAPSP